ncbi:arginyl-tRNA synthetase [Candidatus Mancarchaeum acidiphilum]|uniref:arginine--tRNA ligase n=1 Tax=Candidatus Mancarchaeum acidiphilum TaxID=1920749 RepID=A0A218NNJ1_9ARCH|nr:arginine--tRNA ligase [Candidatus Mancarchaeum acidiphilum]ASI14022.1 arginyl-tRNA synthetase [Candidatus Mancarchaeum acidiphilum]
MSDSPFSQVKGIIAARLKEFSNSIKLDYSLEDIESTIDLSKKFGDLSSSMLMKISKVNGISMDSLVSSIKPYLSNIDYFKEAKVESGFINFYLDKAKFSKLVLELVDSKGEDFMASDSGKGIKVIVESPSVNPVHPWHVGQVRSALLGDTISNMMESCGYEVEREDYIDDLGLQSAEALWGLINKDKLNINLDPEEKYDHYIGKIYVATNTYMQSNNIEEEIKSLSKEMEIDGTYESNLLHDSVSNYITAEYETAFKLNIYHDNLIWESDIVRNNLLEKAMDLLLKKGIVEKSNDKKYEGCIVINYNKMENLPPEIKGLKEQVKVLIRSNGTPDYLAKDIAFHMWKLGIINGVFKFSEFMEKQPNGKPLYTTSISGEDKPFGNAKITVNTIDSRQSYEQSLVKLSIGLVGGEKLAEGFNHLAYGMVNLEGQKLAGRKGTWIGYTADDLINEAYTRAISLIGSRFNLTDSEKDFVARNISVSAIRYEFLKISNEKELIFSWDNALNFEGNSGPYCEYTHARAVRILENFKGKLNPREADFSKLSTDYESEIIKLLSISQDILERASREMKPNLIVDYLSKLSTSFSKFYEACPVIKNDDQELRYARLLLVSAFEKVSSKSMRILGINPIDRM